MQQSVKKVRDATRERGVAWEDVSPMGEREVYDLLFPEQAEPNEATAQIEYDYDYVPPSETLFTFLATPPWYNGSNRQSLVRPSVAVQ